jgi:hypothetical protein
MPRNSSGNYTLPAGNPVVPNTLIETTWANPTMADIGAGITDSLDRYGRGGMLAQLKLADGTAAQPAFAFNSESSTGLFRLSAGVMNLAILGVTVASFTAAGATISGALSWTGGTSITTSSTDIDPLDTGFPATPNGLTIANNQALTSTFSALSLSAVETGGRNAVVSLVAQSVAGAYQPNLLFIQRNSGVGIERMQLDSSGRLLIGTSAAITNRQSSSSIVPALQVAGTTSNVGLSANVFAANSSTPAFYLGKSRGATVGSQGIVTDGEALGLLSFNGSDGVTMREAARIMTQVSGAVGVDSVPGVLSLMTTSVGALIPSAKLQVGPNGEIGVGVGPTAGASLRIGRNISGSVFSYGLLNNGVVQPDATSAVIGVFGSVGTAAAAFVLPSLAQFRASQSTFGAGSSVTNQYGFYAHASLIGATNNYGFYADIPAGVGRFNLYMGGSANNFMEGNLGIGVQPHATIRLHVSKATGGEALRLDTGAAASSSYMGFYGNGSAIVAGFVGGAAGVVTGGTFSDMCMRGENSILLAISATEKARITNAGLFINDGGSLYEAGFRGLPSASVSTGAFVASDRGKCVYATGGVTANNSTMSGGDCVTIINITAGAITITAAGGLTLRQAGTANIGNRTLAGYGIATIVYLNSTAAFISGTGLT